MDYFTKYTLTFFIKLKLDLALLFDQLKSFIENFFHTKIKTIYFNSGDYQGLIHVLAKHGVQHLRSPPYTLQLVSIS